MRKKKHAGERIMACAEYLYDFDKINNISNEKPVHLEIGCGMGDFICSMAQKFPEIDFVAVEKISSVIVVAIEKAKSYNLPNVRFVVTDAEKLADHFPENYIDVIYLNFSDPWHKRYQQNKRLTSPVFLDIYKKFIKRDAKIIMKTDNINLFDYSVKTLPLYNFEVVKKTHDLYSSEFFDSDKNVQTEYEKKFAAQNIPICFLSAIYLQDIR